MGTETHTCKAARYELDPQFDTSDHVVVLMGMLHDCGMRHGTEALLEDWKRAKDAAGLGRTYPIPDGAWYMLRPSDWAQGKRKKRDKKTTTVEAVAELAAETLSASERLQLAQFLLATVTTDVEDAPDATFEVNVTAGGSTSRSASKRQADLDAAKKSVLDSLEVIDSKEVARILAPTSAAVRSVAQKRRTAGDLIGLPVGARPNYLYPLFQFDTGRHKIYDVVCHANRRLFVNEDPYGAASWWLTAHDMLDGNSPLEDLEAGQLTEIAVDNVIDDARQGM